eukprot:TRINITY_DN20400_c2_g1_i1.p1 TRINITY_DN20400_c2_g1~~TRINITY_DN20400_c2_g1_i1.p1  ORF type:complete len:314 (-),score=41.21 TRINITY_DN20400_c2_g1_i1:725-1564(-)
MAPICLANPADVVREDGTDVVFQKAESPSDEIYAAVRALGDPFIKLNLLFYLASNWFYTYDFNGFNGSQFNVRTRGLNSASFWASQMLAAWIFGKLLDSEKPPQTRAWYGMLVVSVGLIVSLGLALRESSHSSCKPFGWEKGRPCELDFKNNYPEVLQPMIIFILLGASDAIYQNYAYWLMSMAAGDDVQKTVMYSAVYKGVQSLGAGCAWLIDLPSTTSYQTQGTLCLLLTLGACVPVSKTFSALHCKKAECDVDNEASVPLVVRSTKCSRNHCNEDI